MIPQLNSDTSEIEIQTLMMEDLYLPPHLPDGHDHLVDGLRVVGF